MRATFPQSSQQDETTAVLMLYHIKFASSQAWSIASFPSPPFVLRRVTLRVSHLNVKRDAVLFIHISFLALSSLCSELMVVTARISRHKSQVLAVLLSASPLTSWSLTVQFISK